ncbi:MAG: glycosyltransferase family 2 protein [Acidobacteria bacterium]|nr:glycosyltransferase family 2 protein [Acidobacteriota bacterium]MBU4401027.1 glycosyltransferase family 2 protein [Planctomycetota bacterium]MCG2812388.1 glycosyltransferase family 2 protein [Candidatus Aminicenantes bacterium]
MSAKPLVSVIIPVFNLEAYLGEAVDSVLNQTFQDFEILLIDDGSTDRSREIIENYRAQLPERIKSLCPGHRGATAARNAGIDAARGQWIAFLDGDDVWQPTKLAEQLRRADADPQCNFVACAAEIYGQKRLFQIIPQQPFDFKIELLRRGCFITLSSALIRRDLLGPIRFDEKLEGAQDIDFFLSLADSTRLEIIHTPLVFYRIRQAAISGLLSKRFLQVHRHFQIARRELQKMQREDPRRILSHESEVLGALRRLAHEAAYYALMNPRANFATRLKLSAIAIAECPGRLKNYRILLQSLLPAAWNQRLAHFRHGDLPVHDDGNDKQTDQRS